MDVPPVVDAVSVSRPSYGSLFIIYYCIDGGFPRYNHGMGKSLRECYILNN